MKKLLILLCLLFTFALWAELVTVSDYPNDIRLTQSTSNQINLEFTLGSFSRETVTIDSQTWYLPMVKNAGLTLEAGLPQVPVLAGSVIIPPTAKMVMNATYSEYVDIPMPIAPSKGNLTRNIDPNTVPYSFGSFYQSSGSYPEETAYLTEPYILRDYRGITVRFQPFVYYPETGITRVYTRMSVSITTDGVDTVNTISTPKTSYAAAFAGIYENMFLNFGQAKYPSLAETGRILVIKNSMFDAAIEPWVNWKRQMGHIVDVVDKDVAGPTANQIKTYIQNQYDQNNGLMFVQIMGDAPQVPSLSSGGGGSDPSYALLAGNDSYPDIYVGRFSAQTVAEMNTQVARSVYYERDVAVGAEWLQRAMGIASNEGGGSQGDMGESDQVHMEYIRTDLLGYGYTSVDQVYQAQGASAAMVTTNVNNGRGFINYVGHGSDTSWVTTGFNNTNVNNLTNDFMLPFIVSVACVNGNFVSQTCFAEAWLRATNNSNGNPTGAVAMYASTINQGWNPPMRGQDEVTDLLIAEAKHTIGGLYFNGSSKMIEVYGTSGINEYKCWTIFGDASLVVRTKNPTLMTAVYNPVLLIGMSSFSVITEPNAWLTLSNGTTIYGKTVADAGGNAVITLNTLPDQPMDLTLTITSFNKQTHLGIVQVLPANGPYIIVTNATVSDNNNNVAEFGEIITVNVEMNNVGSDPATGVTVSVTTDDSYLSVVTPQEVVANIPANAFGNTITGIQLAVANNVPNQHVAQYTVVVTLDNESIYTSNRSLTIAAPEIAFGFMQVDDAEGNDNGRIDPGELFTISIPFTNTGNADAPPVHGTIMVSGGDHLIFPIINDFDFVPQGSSFDLVNQIALSSQIPAGTTIQITAMCTFGEYLALNNYNIVVGILAEDFESGFVNYPWGFTNGNWTISEGGYNNTSAAKSPAIGNSQSTSMSVTLTNPSDGIISFWKKVSSEAGYDYLRFYINGQMKNQWSGIDTYYSQASYMVAAGTNTYKWEYYKDGGGFAGADCAWVDEIVFPAAQQSPGVPVFNISTTSMDFGNLYPDQVLSQSVTLSNLGDAIMMGTLQLPEPYTLGEPNEATVDHLTYILAPGAFQEYTVTFRPTEEGVYAAFLRITSDDPNAVSNSIFLMGSCSPVNNEDIVNPVITALSGNYPNPFNPSTTIQFSLKERGHVSLEVFNILGQKVKTLVDNELTPGAHSVAWNGKDNKGQNLPSGVYFYRMKSGRYTSTKKMIMMK